MNARERLQGINRTLDALGTVEASLSKTESTPDQAMYKRVSIALFTDFKASLQEWANYERERLA